MIDVGDDGEVADMGEVGHGRGGNIGTGAGRRNGGAGRLEKTVSRETSRHCFT